MPCSKHAFEFLNMSLNFHTICAAYLQPRYMETPEKRRKNKKAARTQHPQRYCPPSFLVKRMSLSDDKIELGVPARLNLLVLTVLTEIYGQKRICVLHWRLYKYCKN